MAAGVVARPARDPAAPAPAVFPPALGPPRIPATRTPAIVAAKAIRRLIPAPDMSGGRRSRSPGGPRLVGELSPSSPDPASRHVGGGVPVLYRDAHAGGDGSVGPSPGALGGGDAGHRPPRPGVPGAIHRR